MRRTGCWSRDRGAATVDGMDSFQITPLVHTPFADLDLLLAEEHEAQVVPAGGSDEREPDTVDAFNAQILAGLVSP